MKRKLLYNNTLLDKYPYFFRYVYKDTNKQYREYLDKTNIISKQKYQMDFHTLESLQRKTPEQKQFIDNFYEYCPVVISESPMNLLCMYIESINFEISKKIKGDVELFDYNIYKNYDYDNYDEFYDNIIVALKDFIKNKKNEIIIENNQNSCDNEVNDNKEYTITQTSDLLFDALSKINSNVYIVLNCLIDYFYKDNPKSNKDLLWDTYGKYIYKNIVNNSDSENILFPMPCKDNTDYDLEYLGYHYKLQEVNVK